ncbi:ASCH domain-containing protein [Onishia niordana]|uniref:ASCH domain-containing protein n=1 Tax=Onishia niordana TaxID=2508711 RepID=UPI0014480BDC|nr:ASCH domain-containing protein [Halomonas niordiana]
MPIHRLPRKLRLGITQAAEIKMSHKKSIIISIKPRWAEKILGGDKTVELRKSFTPQHSDIETALIYASSPKSAIIGKVKIEKVKHDNITNLWNETMELSFVSKNDFSEYFSNKKSGNAIFMSSPQRTQPLKLDYLRDKYNFTPPVSWRWIKEKETPLLEEAE